MLTSTAEAATPACPVHPSSRNYRCGRAIDPKVSAAWKSRQCGDLPPASDGPSLKPPRPPEGSHGCPAEASLAVRISAEIRRHGSRLRTARSARARRRSSTSSKRLPAPLRPTTRRKRSFRGKGLRRADTVYRLNQPSQPSAVRKQWPFFPADDPSPLPCRPLGAGSAPPKNRERLFQRRRTICRHACTCEEYVPIP